MSRMRLTARLRQNDYFRPMQALLRELAIDYRIVPPAGRGHPILTFRARDRDVRIPLPSTSSNSRGSVRMILEQIRRAVRTGSSR